MKRLIVISPEKTIENETAIVNTLFDEGLKNFHLRKPSFTTIEQEKYLSEIKPGFLKNIALHQHHTVTLNDQVSRLHFKENERVKQDETKLSSRKEMGMHFSSSLHDGDKIGALSPVWDYVFLGPIFSSISKQGYENKTLETFVLEKKNKMPEIIAIGGIDKTNAETILNRGFDGIAVLGVLWNNFKEAINTFKTLQVICGR